MLIFLPSNSSQIEHVNKNKRNRRFSLDLTCALLNKTTTTSETSPAKATSGNNVAQVASGALSRWTRRRRRRRLAFAASNLASDRQDKRQKWGKREADGHQLGATATATATAIATPTAANQEVEGASRAIRISSQICVAATDLPTSFASHFSRFAQTASEEKQPFKQRVASGVFICSEEARFCRKWLLKRSA